MLKWTALLVVTALPSLAAAVPPEANLIGRTPARAPRPPILLRGGSRQHLVAPPAVVGTPTTPRDRRASVGDTSTPSRLTNARRQSAPPASEEAVALMRRALPLRQVYRKETLDKFNALCFEGKINDAEASLLAFSERYKWLVYRRKAGYINEQIARSRELIALINNLPESPAREDLVDLLIKMREESAAPEAFITAAAEGIAKVTKQKETSPTSGEIPLPPEGSITPPPHADPCDGGSMPQKENSKPAASQAPSLNSGFLYGKVAGVSALCGVAGYGMYEYNQWRQLTARGENKLPFGKYLLEKVRRVFSFLNTTQAKP